MHPEEFIDRIRQASACGTALRIRGGGSKDWYGQSGAGELLDTRSHAGIIDYDPSELVITARCGTRLDEIVRTLAEQHQMLAFEPPSWTPHATLGGVVASGLSGPRRPYAGGLRDFMLGAVILDGKGELLSFGGQVMKNVAGYDVARLMAGSMGCLGLILEVSLKVLPMPETEVTIAFEHSQADSLAAMQSWRALPLPVSATSWEGSSDNLTGITRVRLSGSQAGVHAAMIRLGGQVLDPEQGAAHWHAVREQTHPFFSGRSTLWRISLPAGAAPLEAGAQLIEWGGMQRWLPDPQLPPAALRKTVAALGGHVTRFRGPDQDVEVFEALAEPLMRIHRRLKTAFDPQGVFNPGRLYPDL